MISKILHMFLRSLAPLTIACAPPASLVCAQSSPHNEPILRIETGTHTAIIRRIAVDSAGKYLITGSDDKTVRIWDAQNGQLLRIVRLPIGPDTEGRIFAVAISPDGNTIACGGWTGATETQTSLYFIDRRNGLLTRRIFPLPTRACDLAFSKDGRLLAVAGGTRSSTGGVFLFHTEDGTSAGQDTDYGNQSYGTDFDAAGHLVTSCLDGYVRVYDTKAGSLHLLQKAKASGGTQPFGIRFSPDGARIAVSYLDTTTVSVLNTTDLSLRFAPDTSGVTNLNMSCVCWSTDGQYLLAGGKSKNFKDSMIRRWAGAGEGAFIDFPAAKQTLFDIRSIAGGQIYYGAADPAFGTFNLTSGNHTLFVPPKLADFRNNTDTFRITTNGQTVSVALAPFGKNLIRFSIQDRSLVSIDQTSIDNTAQPPITVLNGVTITDWDNMDAPKLNGHVLALKPHEFCQSRAIAPGGKTFLLGTDWYVRCFDSAGNELWNTHTPGAAAYDVNISSDGKIGVAACGDGTIRWYRMKDGVELLAFFALTDKRRWIIWTPSGYYDCSTGGEDLVGWHINRAPDQTSDFFPASQFHKRFYRPDIISHVLTTLDETEAVHLADAAHPDPTRMASGNPAISATLPPVIRVLSPSDGATVADSTVTIRYAVRTPSEAPVTDVHAKIDGVNVAISGTKPITDPAAKPDELVGEIKVPLSSKNCQLALFAANKHATSAPCFLNIVVARDPGPPPLAPKLYVLAIGVGQYPKLPHLKYPPLDARAFVAAIQQQKGHLYRDVVVHQLTDADATRDHIVDALDQLQTQTTSRDVAMIFIAGHGTNDSNQKYQFTPENYDPDHPALTGISSTVLFELLNQIPGKVLLFLDTCNSGNVLNNGARDPIGVDYPGLVNMLVHADSGVVVYCASAKNQSATENEKWGNGAFTKALVEGLTGQPDPQLSIGSDASAALALINSTHKVTFSYLEAYLSERVKELTEGRQTPTSAKPGTVPDIVFATISHDLPKPPITLGEIEKELIALKQQRIALSVSTKPEDEAKTKEIAAKIAELESEKRKLTGQTAPGTKSP